MKSKRFMKASAVLLSLFLIFALFAGCKSTNGGTQTTTTGAGTTTRAGTTTTAAATTTTTTEAIDTDPFGKYEPVLTINVARYLDPNTAFDPSDPDRESLEKNIWAKVYEETLGIKFNYIWTAPLDQYTTRWNLAITTGDIPDLAYAPMPIFLQLVEEDLIEDMTDYFDMYASPLYKKAQEDDLGVIMNYSTYGGRLYGLPINGASLPDSATMLFVRQDWLDNVGLSFPETTEQMYEIAKAFTFDDANRSGSQDTYGLVPDLVGVFNSFGAYLNVWTVDGQGKLAFGNIQPEVKDALLYLRDMYQEGLIPTDFVVRGAQMGADISSEKVGMMFGPYFTPVLNMNDTVVSNPNAEWTIGPIPSRPGQISKTQTEITAQGAVIVRRGYEHPEAAVKIVNLDLQLFNDDPAKYGGPNNLHKYRVAGEIWMPNSVLNIYYSVVESLKTNGASEHLNSTAELHYNNILKANEGDRTALFSNYLLDPGNSVGAVMDYYLKNDRLMPNKYQTAPTEGMLDLIPTLNEMTRQVYYAIIMGESSIDEFDRMVTDWKRMGGDDITKDSNDWWEAVQ